jgi:O-antigen/teichoic acid export membrane protein
MFVLIWTSGVFDFWAAEQRVRYKYKLLVAVTILVSVAKPTLGIFLVLHSEDKVTARILGLAIVELVGYSWMFFSQMVKGKKIFSLRYWIYALKFNIPLIPHYLSQTVLNNSDRIMITRMVGDSAAGIYSLAYSISLIMSLINTSLLNTISPWIYQKIKNRKTDEIAPVAYSCLILVAGVNILLIAMAPEVVAVFAPSSYYEAIYIIPPVAMSVFFMFCYDLFAKFEFYYEKTNFIMLASVCSAIVNIVLNYIFIGIFGYYAAGYTTLLCYIIYAASHYCFMKKVCRECMDGVVVYNTKILVCISGVFCGLGFMFLFTYKMIVVRYILVIILSAVLMWKRKYIIDKAKCVLNLKGK